MRLFHKLSAGFLVLAAQTYISYHSVRGLPISYNNFPSLTLPYLPYLSITYHALQYLTMPHHTYASEAACCPAEQRLEQLMLRKRNSKSNWKPSCNHEMTFALIFNFGCCSSFSACFAANSAGGSVAKHLLHGQTGWPRLTRKRLWRGQPVPFPRAPWPRFHIGARSQTERVRNLHAAQNLCPYLFTLSLF